MIINKINKCNSVPRLNDTNQTHTKCKCVVFKTISTPPPLLRMGPFSAVTAFYKVAAFEADYRASVQVKKSPHSQILHRPPYSKLQIPK